MGFPHRNNETIYLIGDSKNILKYIFFCLKILDKQFWSLKMSEKSGLIPAKNAMIVWKPKKKQEDFDLKVYYKDASIDCKEFCKQIETDPHWRYHCSSGGDLKIWPKLTEVQMFSECMKILFREGVTNKDKIKNAIFEFGKILELHEMRVLYHDLYYAKEMPFEGLEKSFYAWDFCNRE